MPDELDFILSAKENKKSSKKTKDIDELDLILSPKKEEKPGMWRSLKEGFQEGVTDIYQGIRSRTGDIVTGLIPGTGAINDVLDDPEYQAMKKGHISASRGANPITHALGEATGTVAALPIPPLASGSTLGSGILGAALRGGVNTGAAAGLQSALSAKNSELPIQEAFQKGALPGAIMGGAVGGIGGLVSKGVQSLIKPGLPQNEIAGMSEMARQTGLKPTYGELSQAPTAQSIENLMSSFPLGNMRRYTEESVKSVEPSVNKFIKTMSGKWADVPETKFYDQLKLMETSVKSKASELYDTAAAAAKAENLKPNIEPLKNLISNQIEIYKDLPGKEAKRIVAELNDQLSHTKNLSYEKIAANVKYLSNLAFKKYKQFENGTALPDEYKLYYKLRDSYLDALDTPAASVNTKAALNSAREFYKSEVAPFLDPKMQQYMSQEIAMDKFLKSMTGEAKAGKSSYLLNKLPDETKQLLRKDLLEFIRNDATGADGTLNVTAFLRKLNQYNPLKTQIFGDELPKFEAYTKLLNYVQPEKRLDKTGLMVGATIGGIGAAIGAAQMPSTAAVTLPAAALLWGYSRMATTETGQKMLSSLAKITNNTDPYLQQSIQKKSASYLSNILKQIPSIYYTKQVDEER